MTELLAWIDRLPDLLVYPVLAIGAALENIVPAVPADTFVALGGFAAGAGSLDPIVVGVSTWLANSVGALAVFAVCRKHGPAFFQAGWGRYVMRPHQMARVERFYARWGLPAIFFSRFLPGVRAVVPVFAGATGQSFRSVLLPIATASAIWYGGLVWLGFQAGRNLDRLAAVLEGLNLWLGAAAGTVAIVAALWWIRSRRAEEPRPPEASADE